MRLTLVSAVAGGLALIAMPAAAAELTLAHHDSVSSINTRMADSFIQCVQGKSKLKINHMPAAQMGTAREILEQLKMGAIQMSSTDVAYMSNLEPGIGALLWPFMFTSWEHTEAAMKGKAGEHIRTVMLKNHGIRVIAYMHNGFRDFMTVKVPMKTLADFKGVKFRSPPIPAWIEMFKALGAEPVPIPWSEVYTAVQTRVVDGLETSAEGMINSKVYEVGKYVAKSGHMYNMMALVIKETVHAGLQPGEKEALATCGKDYTEVGNATFRKLETESYKELEAKGLKINDIDRKALQQALKPAWDILKKDVKGADEMIKLIGEAG